MVLIGPRKRCFWFVCNKVGKTSLAFSGHCVLIQAEDLYTFPFSTGALTNDGGTGCYLQVCKIGPSMAQR